MYKGQRSDITYSLIIPATISIYPLYGTLCLFCDQQCCRRRRFTIYKALNSPPFSFPLPFFNTLLIFLSLPFFRSFSLSIWKIDSTKENYSIEKGYLQEFRTYFYTSYLLHTHKTLVIARVDSNPWLFSLSPYNLPFILTYFIVWKKVVN